MLPMWIQISMWVLWGAEEEHVLGYKYWVCFWADTDACVASLGLLCTPWVAVSCAMLDTRQALRYRQASASACCHGALTHLPTQHPPSLLQVTDGLYGSMNSVMYDHATLSARWATTARAACTASRTSAAVAHCCAWCRLLCLT